MSSTYLRGPPAAVQGGGATGRPAFTETARPCETSGAGCFSSTARPRHPIVLCTYICRWQGGGWGPLHRVWKKNALPEGTIFWGTRTHLSIHAHTSTAHTGCVWCGDPITKNAIGSSTNCCCKLVLQRHKKHHGVPRNNLLVRACIVATTFDSGSRKVCRRSGNGAYQEKCLGQAASRRVARLPDTLANKRRLHSLECLVVFGSIPTIYPPWGTSWALPRDNIACKVSARRVLAHGTLSLYMVRICHNLLYTHTHASNQLLYMSIG